MTHTVEATAWTLIHFCWQAAVIAGVYRVLSAAFSRRASQTRYVMALVGACWPCSPRPCSPLRGRCARTAPASVVHLRR